MKTVIIISLSALMFAGAQAAPIDNAVSSALMPGDSVVYNLDFIDPFGLPILDVMVNSRVGNTEYSTIMDHLTAPQYLNTYEGTQDYSNPTGQIEFYGRVEADTLLLTQSYKNENNQFPPSSILYADLADDAVGDTMPGTAGEWLDITGSAVTYSDDRIYARLSNAGGGWPTNQGLDFFAYGFVLYNPDNPNFTALALVYVNVPFFYTPGLFSIDLTDTSFTRIADIQTQTSGTDLHMSCAISDMLQDPNWNQWPPESGYILTGGLTISVVSFEPNLNDFTYPSAFIPMTQYVNTNQNIPPTLSNIAIDPIPPITLGAGIHYLDGNNNLPVQRSFIFDGVTYEMGSLDHSYVDGSDFATIIPWPGDGWHAYYFSFSDGDDIAETQVDSIYLAQSGIDNESVPLVFELSQNYPNPFNARTTIEFQLPDPEYVELTVYDIMGKRIIDLADANFESGKYNVVWDGNDSSGETVSSGLYFYRLNTGSQSIIKKMTLLK